MDSPETPVPPLLAVLTRALEDAQRQNTALRAELKDADATLRAAAGGGRVAEEMRALVQQRDSALHERDLARDERDEREDDAMATKAALCESVTAATGDAETKTEDHAHCEEALEMTRTEMGGKLEAESKRAEEAEAAAAEAQQRIDDLLEQLSASDTTVTNLKTELERATGLQAKHHSLQRKLDDEAERAQKAETALKESEKRVAELYSDLNTANALAGSAAKELQKVQESKRGEGETAQSTIDELTSKLTTAESTNTKLTSSLTLTKSDLASARELLTTRTAELRTRSAELAQRDVELQGQKIVLDGNANAREVLKRRIELLEEAQRAGGREKERLVGEGKVKRIGLQDARIQELETALNAKEREIEVAKRAAVKEPEQTPRQRAERTRSRSRSPEIRRVRIKREDMPIPIGPRRRGGSELPPIACIVERDDDDSKSDVASSSSAPNPKPTPTRRASAEKSTDLVTPSKKVLSPTAERKAYLDAMAPFPRPSVRERFANLGKVATDYTASSTLRTVGNHSSLPFLFLPNRTVWCTPEKTHALGFAPTMVYSRDSDAGWVPEEAMRGLVGKKVELFVQADEGAGGGGGAGAGKENVYYAGVYLVKDMRGVSAPGSIMPEDVGFGALARAMGLMSVEPSSALASGTGMIPNPIPSHGQREGNAIRHDLLKQFVSGLIRGCMLICAVGWCQ
ncbi:hypothetical protein HMN09_01184300 [Mycena chlorophos]|uniref:Uncharacterized protein n=1 Tax=Mycena chlorophos TaxID=658473 RepID=A0A8H6VTZ9_MYCCL|nr:hypothetical protein HMN09_01184300 [Mycena chlorophos]